MKYYIIEDHEEMRELWKTLLEQRYPTLICTGEAESGEAALREIPLKDPELVLVDISLPGMNGIEVIRRLKPQCEAAWFLIVTSHQVEDFELAARTAGADDIISKSEPELLVSKVGDFLCKSEMVSCSW